MVRSPRSSRIAFDGPLPGAVLAFLLVLTLPLRAGWNLVEDFESGFTAGSTLDGIDGWVSVDPSEALAAVDPASSGRGTVGLAIGQQNVLRKILDATDRIAEGSTGTLFFEVYLAAGGDSPNVNLGLSDVTTANGYTDFEAQVRCDGPDLDLLIRDGGGFLDTGYRLDEGAWAGVWMVIDNASDTVDLHVQTPSGQVGKVEVASGYDFRNGTSDVLQTFLLIQQPGVRDLYFDNVFIDTAGENLDDPPIAATLVTAVDDAVEVGVGGAIRFDATANDTGSFDPGSIEILAGPSAGIATLDAATGEIVYRHGGGPAGSDSFTYRIANPSGSQQDDATVAVGISSALRIDNTTAAVPAEAPSAAAGELVVEEALPGFNFPGAVAMTSIPGRPKELLIASINGTVWWIPDSTAASPSVHEVLDVGVLSNFNHGRSIYSIECFPDVLAPGDDVAIILNYQGDEGRLPTPLGDIPGLDKNGADEGGDGINCDLRISRFTLSASHLAACVDGLGSAENEAALLTEFPYLNLAEQDRFHCINDAKFHWDPSDPLRKYYLYVSFGDEGAQGSPYWNTQKITKDQFSSIIRIDLNPASTNPKPNPHYAIPVGGIRYSGTPDPGVNELPNTVFSDAATQQPNFRVPQDNPFVHTAKGGAWDGWFNGIDHGPGGRDDLAAVRDEIWALGLRNPFKIHVDFEDASGDTVVIVGDVGKDDREEFSVLKSGDNGGWGYYEGDIVAPGMSEDPAMPVPAVTRDPIFAYEHTLGNSATGGVFYRGSELTALAGRYVCADFGSGRVWSMNLDGSGRVEHAGLRQSSNKIVDFHVDGVTGEVFMLENNSWSGGTARLLRIVEEGETEDYPQTLAELGLFADLGDPSGALVPNPGVVGYEPNLRFWSDGADKHRWFLMPDGVSTMGYSRDEPWSFPPGFVAVKHFDHDFGGEVVRIETRVMRYDGGDTYGVSYRWNESGTAATLVPTEGLEVSFDALGNVTTDPQQSVLDWVIPSRAECLTCHNPAAGHALSLNTRQLNREATIHGQTGNLLALLSDGGFLSGLGDDPASLARHHRPDETSVDLETRARSYLDVNCAYCHREGGGVPPGSWDGRAHLTIGQTGLLYGSPVGEGVANLADHMVRPGQGDHSIILNRMKARNAGSATVNGESQMPALATHVVDAEGVALIEDWIENHANAAPTPAAGSLDNPMVSENALVGYILGLADAVDPDVRDGQADQDLLSYEIVAGNEGGLFSLDPLSGELRLNGWVDFERQPRHVLTIRVSDHFAPNPGVLTHTVVIDLADETAPDTSDDLDGNGIFDSWEASFPLTSTDPASDQDMDGVPLVFEFLSGGNPVISDAAEGFAMEVVGSDPEVDFGIAWNVRNGFVLGADYEVAGSELLDGWSLLAAGVDYEVVSVEPVSAGISRVVIRRPSGAVRSFLNLARIIGP